MTGGMVYGIVLPLLYQFMMIGGWFMALFYPHKKGMAYKTTVLTISNYFLNISGLVLPTFFHHL